MGKRPLNLESRELGYNFDFVIDWYETFGKLLLPTCVSPSVPGEVWTSQCERLNPNSNILKFYVHGVFTLETNSYASFDPNRNDDIISRAAGK